MNGPVSLPQTQAHALTGVVHGGQQPVKSAHIQLYGVNATTDQGASTPLLTSSVTTGSDGGFTLTNLYTCPPSNPFVYLASTAGDPGVGSNNSDIAMIALIGRCSTLTSTTYIVINELTTAMAAYSIAPFIGDAGHIGSSTTNLGSIAQGIQSATSSINLATGTFGTSFLFYEQQQITTNADILAACVNTAGGAAGSATPCGSLLSLAGSGVFDTLAAAVQMALFPTNNAAQLFALITGTPPFQPYFTTLPSDLAVTVGFPTPRNGRAVALDSTGQPWVYTGGYTYDTSIDTSTDLQGVVTVYDNNLNPIRTITPPTGGLYYPVSATSDAAGHVFFINSNNTVSEFTSGGTAVSPAGGWSTGVATTFTGSSLGNGYVTNATQVESIRVDAQGNIWGITPVGSTNCYVEMNSSGVVITPVGTFCTAAGGASDLSPDGSGNAWTNGSLKIGKVDSTGALAASAPNSASCFYPSSVASAANFATATNTQTAGLGYDHVSNHLWAYSETGAGAITNGGTAVFCDAGSATLPVILPFGPSAAALPGSPYVGGSLLISSGVLDGAGNFWYLTTGTTANGVVGTSYPYFSGTATVSTYLNGISPSGALLTPYNAATKVYGNQPSGVGANASVTMSNAVVSNSSSLGGASLLGVDVNGNMWVSDSLSNRVIKLTGIATANTVNY